jgi:hypothetical protein
MSSTAVASLMAATGHWLSALSASATRAAKIKVSTGTSVEAVVVLHGDWISVGGQAGEEGGEAAR